MFTTGFNLLIHEKETSIISLQSILIFGFQLFVDKSNFYEYHWGFLLFPLFIEEESEIYALTFHTAQLIGSKKV